MSTKDDDAWRAGAPPDAVLSTCTGAPRPVFWSAATGSLWLMDQRLLPGSLALFPCSKVADIVTAIAGELAAE